MASKIVNLTDVAMGTIYLHQLENGLLPVKANYTLVGDDVGLIAAAGTFVTERNPEWATLPQNIKDALILINNYMKTAALQDRGMA